MSSQIVGGPGWIDTDRYGINAKAANAFGRDLELDTFRRLQAMLRALLEDRFQAKVNTEMRDVPIYALVLANKEPKFGTLFKLSTAKCYTRDDPRHVMAHPIPHATAGFAVGTATSRMSA